MKPKIRTFQWVCILIVVAFSTAWIQPSQAAIPFTHTTDLVTAAPSSRGVAVADFNRDGVLDLVLTGLEDASGHGSVSVFLGNGDGTFAPGTTYSLPIGALAVAAADVNSDSFPDLAVGTRDNYMLLLGNGDGSFAPATELEPQGTTFVSFADLNADGHPDIVASTASSVRIRLGNGDGTFRPAITIAFPDCVYGKVLHGDFNGDAHTDLAVIRCSDVVSVLLGKGDGTFQSPVDYPVTHGPNAGDVGDLNSDGHLDLAIVGTQSSTVSVLMGNGDGTFTPGATIATGVYPIDAALGDLNSDNIPDLVVAVYFGNAVEVFAGRGDGTFEQKIGYATGITPSVALGDWDRDGLLDIAASNWGGALTGSQISLFRNTPGVLVGASPVVTAPSTVTGAVGSLITFNVSAVDPDGDAISSLRALQLLGGGELPAGATFTPDATNASGTFRWTPDSSAGGRSFDVAFVAQNALSGSARTTISVGNVSNRPPVLAPIANMSVAPGVTADQGISATDPDGDAITFTSSGPAFMTLTQDAQVGTTRAGNIHLAPSGATSGTFQASVTATANGQFGDQTFMVTVHANGPPTLNQPANMTVNEGAIADQTLMGSDPDGDALTFSRVAGPSFMTVTNNNATTGNVHLAPGFSDAGNYPATVRASDGSLSDDKTFAITVNNVPAPPVLATIPNMSLVPGSIADQGISATDPDADAITFTSSGPAFMTVTSNAQVGNTRTGNIHLAPGFSDAGTFPATVTATANGQFDDQTFTITVSSNRAPVLNQPANMTVSPGATADQALVASDPEGDVLTFSMVSGPTFMSVTTTTINPPRGNVHLAPGFADAFGTATAVVRVSDGSLADTKSFTITVTQCHGNPTLIQPANMTVAEGATADQIISGTDACGDALTFSKVAGPTFMTVTTTNATTGNIHLAPGFSDAGSFLATVRVTDGSLANDKSFTITTASSNSPPILAQPANMTVTEGATADQILTGVDPDSNPLAFSKVTGPIFMTVLTLTATTGNVHLAPGFSDGGTYTATVRVSDGTLTDTKSFTITVRAGVNRCPVSNPGGPYSGLAGVPLAFDGRASFDPDGSPLSYAWDFDASDGVGTDAMGPTVGHTYTAGGAFVVTLAVSDGACSVSATTAANILASCLATVFNGYDVIRLGTGKPTWFALVQPASGCYVNTDVVLPSFVLKYAGRQIPAEVTKSTVDSDKNGDGIPEIRVTFSKGNLRTLFSGTGLGNGHNIVTVTIEASLVTGGLIQGTTQVDAFNNGSFSAPTVAPNPLNPSATLTFTTSRPGAVKIDLYDVGGRLVRTILEERQLTAGAHDVRIEGRGSRGEALASGIYFIRGVSAEGEFTKAIAILK
jgi:hypothetical protein